MIVPITHQRPEKIKENWDRAYKKYGNDCECGGIELTDSQAIVVICIMFVLLSIAFYNLLTIED